MWEGQDEQSRVSKYVYGADLGGQLLAADPGLGTDPAADGFGSVRFRAEVPGSDAVAPRDHSYYYHLGSEALHSMADIPSGHGDALASDGMLAQRRHQPYLQVTIPGLGSVGVNLPGTPAALIRSGIAPHNPLPTAMSSMTNTITERSHQWSRQAWLAVAGIVVMLVGGCALVMTKPHSGGSSNPWDDSAHPLTDDQAMAQVIEPAKQIVAAADLQELSAGFSFASCNDQGDPPYQGIVTMHFLLHGDPDTYFQKVQASMIAHGWNDGAPPGQHLHGTTLNKNGVTANTGLFPSDHSYGEITLYGECRNTTDHHNDGKTNSTDITNQLRGE